MNGVKLTRSQLKSMVKECLVEILQEGLGASGPVLPVSTGHNYSQFSEGKQIKREGASNSMARPRNSALDTPIGQHDKGRYSSTLVEAIKQESRGNALMADILADTAMTTLPKMMSSGDSNGGSSSGNSSRVSQVEHFNGSPEQVFGEDVASKWANLAFMDVPKRKLS